MLAFCIETNAKSASSNKLEHNTHGIRYYLQLMYKTAVYTLVNGTITHQKPQI